MREVSARRSTTVFCLAAALLAGSVVRAGETRAGGKATGAVAAGDTAPAARAERHSPREGFPSLGPAGAKTTLVFFTDYQ